jgi:hypothetical protein
MEMRKSGAILGARREAGFRVLAVQGHCKTQAKKRAGGTLRVIFVREDS